VGLPRQRKWAVAAGLALILLGWATPVRAVNDLNCSDFGTRERAQREFLKNATDIHRLDADNDGKACEWNSSTGWWVWPIAGAALVVGRTMGRRRVGDHRMVPGAQGIVFNYEFSEDGCADKVLDRITPILLLAGVTALPVTTVLREYIFPRSATPIAFYIAIGALGSTVAYFATLKLLRRDLYVVDLATKDEGEL
jgi:drug/metabolite transporter (DMT)-like permease